MKQEGNANPIYRINLLLFIVVVITAIVIQYTILPGKYFYDRWAVISLMEMGAVFRLQDSYLITAYLSDAVNIFGLNTPLQWSIFYAVIMNPVLYIILRKKNFSTLPGLLWVYAAIGLLNIYTFVIGKDIFQYIIYLMIYFVIGRKNIKDTSKIILCAAILLSWGIVFRIYFILIAAFSLMVYILLRLYKFMKLRRMLIPAAVLGVFVILLILRLIAPDEYMTIITVHSRLNFYRGNSPDAQTIIVNLIPNDKNNLALFMVNFSINLFRMLFPVEILFRFQIHYVLFFIFQIMLVYLIYLSLRKTLRGEANPASILALSVYFGYILGSALFEPDFGSWLRHEITVFPVLMVFATAQHDKLIKN